MSYKSTTYHSCNEIGDEEVTIEYAPSFFRWLFRLPLSRTYVGSSTVWYTKGAGARASVFKESEICDIVEYHRQLSEYLDLKSKGAS